MEEACQSCPLCQGQAQIFKAYKRKTYFQCNICQGIFLGKEFHLDSKAEKTIYDFHENDVEDQNYQNFVLSLVNGIMRDNNQLSKGLDYGCGPGPVITKLLEDNGYNVALYDPYYANHPENLNHTYDFIVTSEVAEHFYKPGEEFTKLKARLNPGGSLYVKTLRYTNGMNFDHWRYKNDPTHVFFYMAETFEWIRETIGFDSLTIYADYIRLSLDKAKK